MKQIASITIVLVLISNLGFSQKKIYGPDGTKNIKGTFAILTDTESVSSLIASSGAIVASVGPALFKAGVGAVRTRAERKAALATATFTSNPVTVTAGIKNKEYSLLSHSYARQVEAPAYKFQELTITVSVDTSNGNLELSLKELAGKYCRAFIKGNKNMLIYEVTVNGRIDYTKDAKSESKDLKTTFLFAQPDAGTTIDFINPSNESRYTNVLKIPKTTTLFTFSLTVKEVNPFFVSHIWLAKFLENYGEDVATILGSPFKQED